MSQPNLKEIAMAHQSEALRNPGFQSYVAQGCDTRLLRNALGRFATGVTLVAIDSPNGPIGMTVNSFSSLSLDPLLVQWSVAKDSGRYQPFVDALEFSVSVLRVEHADMALDFCKNAQAFDNEQWTMNSGEPPLLNSALASFQCKRQALHDAGDHTIIVGQVIEGAFCDGAPLLFFQGEFGQFSSFA